MIFGQKRLTARTSTIFKPRTYSVLAYGQAEKKTSHLYGDQPEMFVDEGMKRVAYTQVDFEALLLEEYRPGE